MRNRPQFTVLLVALLAMAASLYYAAPPSVGAQDGENGEPLRHVVEPGDTWPALSWRYGMTVAELQSANPHPNRRRQPVIGDIVLIPASAGEPSKGELVHPGSDGLLALALRHNANPWQLAQLNGLTHPFQPLFSRPIYIPGGDTPPRDLPAGFHALQLSHVPAQPGQALALRATVRGVVTATAEVNGISMDTFLNGQRLVGVGGTGAFLEPGPLPLTIRSNDGSFWSQPWRFVPGTWDFDQITLTGAAAEIDQEAIAAERARLFELWSVVTPRPQWNRRFRLPLDTFLSFSSTYGARRSYNGGPYSTYHEGVDFSAYAGTPVYAGGGGEVVLAEELYVRGGAVIIDHGLGIYSGYYHMSEVHARPGQVVAPGDLIGEVGTSGLSTGNHLHWDLLVAETWVDAAVWHEQDLACWILAGWGTPCAEA